MNTTSHVTHEITDDEDGYDDEEGAGWALVVYEHKKSHDT